MGWTRDGKPAVLTAAPYSVSDVTVDRIRWWLEQDGNLRSARGAGWYGFGTTQVVMWRADRIEIVRPCEPVALADEV